jgi:hypothetical protein
VLLLVAAGAVGADAAVVRSGAPSPAGADGLHAVAPSGAAADSAAAPVMADSAGVDEAGPETAPADSASAPERAGGAERRDVPLPTRPASRFDQPRWVMLRSLVLPGWGQVHNRAWIKAVAVAGGEGWLGFRIRDDRRTLDQLLRQVHEAQAAGDDGLELVLVDRYNTRLSASQSHQWLLGALVVYALLDAYIDAHFRSFRMEFESDPALPGGLPAGREMHVSLRWTY